MQIIKRSKNLLILIILVSLINCLFSCKKSAEVDESTSDTTSKTEESVFPINSIQSVTLNQLSFSLSYKLTIKSVESGVMYSTDSLSLINGQGLNLISSFTNDFYSVNIDLANFPTHAKVWFKVYYKMPNGVKVYGGINKHDLSPYTIQNKYVVHGLGKENSHSKEYFVNYESTQPYGEFDNSLAIATYNVDNNLSSYKATINGVEISISRIDQIPKSKSQNLLTFDVPENVEVGPAKFSLIYRSKQVYSCDIIIVNGGLQLKTNHPASGSSSFANYFVYDDNLYTYSSYGNSESEANFYKWTSANNTWAKLPNPPQPFMSRHTSTPIIKGLVYFPVYNGESENKYPVMY